MPIHRLFSGFSRYLCAAGGARIYCLEDRPMSRTINWVPASTPPDDGETVIIHTLGGEVWTGFLDGNVWRNVSGARIHEEEPVLHWMPLPLPPEDEE